LPGERQVLVSLCVVCTTSRAKVQREETSVNTGCARITTSARAEQAWVTESETDGRAVDPSSPTVSNKGEFEQTHYTSRYVATEVSRSAVAARESQKFRWHDIPVV